MKQRCLNERNRNYKDYGGRGITVDPRWLGEHGFENFLEDMGRRPSPKHSLDRENNNGPYSKNNCRWATRTEQAANRRSNLLLTYRGETKPITVWARELGLHRDALGRRLLRRPLEVVFSELLAG